MGDTLPSLEHARKVIHLIFHMETTSQHITFKKVVYTATYIVCILYYTLYMIYILHTVYHTIYTISQGGRREGESVDVYAR